MRSPVSLRSTVAVCALAFAACDPPPRLDEPVADGATLSPGDDVIATMGHGVYIGRSGAILPPSPELFERTQRVYLDELMKAARKASVPKARHGRRSPALKLLRNAS